MIYVLCGLSTTLLASNCIKIVVEIVTNVSKVFFIYGLLVALLVLGWVRKIFKEKMVYRISYASLIGHFEIGSLCAYILPSKSIGVEPIKKKKKTDWSCDDVT